jgi:hypothetical protein
MRFILLFSRALTRAGQSYAPLSAREVGSSGCVAQKGPSALFSLLACLLLRIAKISGQCAKIFSAGA